MSERAQGSDPAHPRGWGKGVCIARRPGFAGRIFAPARVARKRTKTQPASDTVSPHK